MGTGQNRRLRLGVVDDEVPGDVAAVPEGAERDAADAVLLGVVRRHHLGRVVQRDREPADRLDDLGCQHVVGVAELGVRVAVGVDVHLHTGTSQAGGYDERAVTTLAGG